MIQWCWVKSKGHNQDHFKIPLHIGVIHLKAIAYFTILPLFLKWSHDYPLSMDNVKLRSKNWVEMLLKGSGDEDVDAIKNEFFTIKGKAKTHQFLPNKVLDLYLGISHKLWCNINNHIEELNTNPISELVCYQALFWFHVVWIFAEKNVFGFYYKWSLESWSTSWSLWRWSLQTVLIYFHKLGQQWRCTQAISQGEKAYKEAPTFWVSE